MIWKKLWADFRFSLIMAFLGESTSSVNTYPPKLWCSSSGQSEQLSLMKGEERVEQSWANMPANLPWICLGFTEFIFKSLQKNST